MARQREFRLDWKPTGPEDLVAVYIDNNSPRLLGIVSGDIEESEIKRKFKVDNSFLYIDTLDNFFEIYKYRILKDAALETLATANIEGTPERQILNRIIQEEIQKYIQENQQYVHNNRPETGN